MKAKRLYGVDANFKPLRDLGAIQVYMRHKVMLQERKDELEAKGITTHNEQSVWEELDKAIRVWQEIADMVYGIEHE